MQEIHARTCSRMMARNVQMYVVTSLSFTLPESFSTESDLGSAFAAQNHAAVKM